MAAIRSGRAADDTFSYGYEDPRMGRRAGSSGHPLKVTDHPIWIDNGHMGRERRTAHSGTSSRGSGLPLFGVSAWRSGVEDGVTSGVMRGSRACRRSATSGFMVVFLMVAACQRPSAPELVDPPPDQRVAPETARLLHSAPVPFINGAAVDFITYESESGRCLDTIYWLGDIRQGTTGGCGTDGTSLRTSGVGIGSVPVDGRDVIVVSGLVDGIEEAELVEVEMASGRQIDLPVLPNGLFYAILPDVNDEPIEFRLIGQSGELMETLSFPPSG